MLEFEGLTEAILQAAMEVHRELGPGLLEVAYEQALCYELSSRGIPFVRQVPCPVRYKGVLLDCEFRIDLLVADTVVVELKAVENILPVHEAQLMTYLKLMQRRVALLLNFNTRLLKDGIMRRII
jgi:GxxExxY protein